MSKKILLGTVFASLLTAGTALADHAGPPVPVPAPAPAPAYGYGYQAAPQQADAGYGYGYGYAPQQVDGARPRFARWISLGEVVVGGRGGRDTLHVGRDDGRLTQLRLVVKRGHAFLSGARLTFGNGESMFVDLRGRIGRDGVAMIDLPGRARFLRSIELVPMFERRAWGYRNRAVIEVLAQRAMGPPPWARL